MSVSAAHPFMAVRPRFGAIADATASRSHAGHVHAAAEQADHWVGHRDTGVDEETLSAGKRLCSKMIKWYQKNNWFHGKTFELKFGKTTFRWAPFTFKCMYPAKHPGSASCSQYTLEAIQKKGVIRGIVLGFGRILNCNPLTQHLPVLKNLFVKI